MNTNHLTHPIREHTITSSIAVVTQGADFAVVNIAVPGLPGGLDFTSNEVHALIDDLKRAAHTLDMESPIAMVLA